MNNEPSMDQAFLEKLKEIVERNLDNEHFGVRDLAREAGMSRSKIHRNLHKLTGQSTTQFIREIRLQHARELLIKQVGTVAEIAYRVGFSSPNYFSKCFHEYYGYPPVETADSYLQGSGTTNSLNEGTHTQASGNNRKATIYSALAMVLLLLIFSGYYLYRNGSGGNLPDRTSIAVLPLHNLTGDADQVYFVDGLHDALIGELGQLSELRVISRTSTLQYRDTEINIREIARELGVKNLIEGSVYKAQDSVRIQLQLIRVEPEEQHIWAENYDRSTADILPLLSEVTRNVAKSVQVSLTPIEDSLLIHQREVNIDAYKAYLRGSYYLNQYTPESYKKGIAYLLEATRIDPADPLPWARLALGYNIAGHGISPPDDAYKLAQAAADRALKLDSSSGEVHLALTIVDLYNNWDWEATRKGFENTFKYDPNIAEAHANYGWFVMLEGGKPDDILNESILAMELDPFTPLYPVYLGFQAWWLGRYDEAIQAAQRSLELDPDYPYGYYVLGSAYAAKGNYNEAIKAHKKAAELNEQWKFGLAHTYVLAGQEAEALEIVKELTSNPTPIDNWGLAEIFTALGDYEQAMQWLEASYESRFSWTPWIEWNPNLEPLYSHSQFQNMLERMNVKSRFAITSNF